MMCDEVFNELREGAQHHHESFHRHAPPRKTNENQVEQGQTISLTLEAMLRPSQKYGAGQSSSSP